MAEIDVKSTHGLKEYFYDLTVESGIWYKYSIARVSSAGEYGRAVIIDKPIMPIFDSAFLVSNDKILKLEYSTTVSGFKRNVLESKTETIGSKYPYIKRNSKVDYKSFSLSSIISALTDKENTFTSKDEIYQYGKELYQDYNEKLRIHDKYDYIYEREFRDKVMDFLYENSIKLFKSPTEGNVLIKIMNINFTPQEQIGRLIYTLNAEAVEIDQCNLYNYGFYNIQSHHIVREEQGQSFSHLGQAVINDPDMFTNNSVNIYSVIQDTHREILNSGNTAKVEDISSVRLIFDSKPSIIKIEGNNQYSIASEPSMARDASLYTEGYLINVDGNYIIINPNIGYYEVPNDVSVNKISVYDDKTVLHVEYVAKIVEELDFEKFNYDKYINEIVGQVYGEFKPGDSLHDILENRYYENYDEEDSSERYTINLASINNIAIEAAPDTAFGIKDVYDKNEEIHVMNGTGYLRLAADDLVLLDVVILGKAEYEKQEDGTTKIKIIEVPVNAMIDYYCETEKEVRQKNV